MDPDLSFQDLVRCDLCEDNVVQNYCDYCYVKLCKLCIGEHISDEYDKHKIVPFQQRKSTLIFPNCKKHSKETCKLQCMSCNYSICAKCSILKEHKDHNVVDLEDSYNSKKENIKKDTEEIENVISPTYEEIRKALESQIASLDGDYEKINTIMVKQGEKWHKEIDRAIEQMKNEINEIKLSHRDILMKHLKEIKQIESMIKENLSTLKDLQRESNVVSTIMEYSSRTNEFGKVPPKIHVAVPTFCPRPVDRIEAEKLIGSIKPLNSTTIENGYTLKKQRGSSRELLDSPKVINKFNTGYTNLRSVSFHSEQEIWASAEVNKIKCFNVKGNFINAIKTKSGVYPNDIAVTSDGCLLFSDLKLKTVNKVVNKQIKVIITLKGWIPGNLCVTSSCDLLVVMCDEAQTEYKVVRYAGLVETQTIQYEKEDKPLYSSANKWKSITENRNLDICVADRAAGAVVVVNQAGKLRFRYTGHSFKSKVNSFLPRGITTNSQSQILVADFGNICIHILDQDGQFLRYIDGINGPSGLCVDTLDNLYVAENKTGEVKVIKYLK
uniref:B box-type domain-containing protein n=1 Tax=Magallana gigas TaxID=29159 RepID=A0A8W8LXK1_MAGGI|nr:tripartite motif-containing protein 2-like [Crassostrea gigas]